MNDQIIYEILNLLYALPGILFALSIHEFSHGYVASKLGDPTAKLSGRLTLNPIKHIDLFGFIAMLVVHFGWAKPVPVNSRYFKKPRRDLALTAVAGPLSNILSAFIATFVYMLVVKFVFLKSATFVSSTFVQGIIMIFNNFIYINVGLAIFNMIPVPPLDGSRILDTFLPPKALLAYHKYEREISIVMMIIIISGFISPLIQNAISFVVNAFFSLAEAAIL